MTQSFEKVFSDLSRRIRSYGVAIRLERMDIETPGKFDGPTITINPEHDPEAACYYLAHSFGSIVLWSLDLTGSQRLFATLRAASSRRGDEPEQFERALASFCRFEEVASNYAVWLLAETGHAALIAAYTQFFRADLDAMKIFHREGVAPAWPAFFAHWKARAERGEQPIVPYVPTPVPRFTPVRIEEQQVVQERDGQP